MAQELNRVWGMVCEKDRYYYNEKKVDAVLAEKDAEIRRLKRALYKACFNWAKSERYTEATWHGDEHREELWANVQTKCLAKVEQYKWEERQNAGD